MDQRESSMALLAFWRQVRFPLVTFAMMMFAIGVGELLYLSGWRHAALAAWTLSMLPIALSLYRMRHRSRLWYGSLELLIALTAFYFVLLGIIEVAKPMTMELVVGRVLIFFVAIYFMVRALDNIREGLGSRLAGRWDSFLGIGKRLEQRYEARR
jgi:hypothetical protein